MVTMESYAEVGRPWDGLGVSVDKDMTPHELLQAAGLDWTLSKRSLKYDLTAEEGKKPRTGKLESHYALVRDDNDNCIGICGKEYVPTQNQRAFEFFKKFVDAGKMRMEAAGSFKAPKGYHIWALSSLDKRFKLPGQDEVGSYILLSHPHIWGESLRIKPTTIRVICWNTYTAALKHGEKGFRYWHNREFDDMALNSAHVAIEDTLKMYEEFRQAAEFLASKKTKKETKLEYVARLFQPELIKTGEQAEIDKAALEAVGGTIIESGSSVAIIDPIQFRRNAFTVYEQIDQSPGANLEAAQGTWWGAFNGVTHAIDHKLGRGRDAALHSAWLGPNAALKTKALDLAIDYARAA